MIWTGWNNGGAGYGFTVDPKDFDPGWATVVVELPGIAPVEVNIAKPSFRKNCPHLIGKRIGLWMQTAGYAPWPDRKPPKFDVRAGWRPLFPYRVSPVGRRGDLPFDVQATQRTASICRDPP